MKKFLPTILAIILMLTFIFLMVQGKAMGNSLNGALNMAPGAPVAADNFGNIVQVMSNAANSDITVTFDQTATSGNLLVAVHFDAGGDALQPSGWSEAIKKLDVGNDDEGAIWYKLSVGTETNVVLAGGVEEESCGIVYEIEGPFNVSPLDKTASSDPFNDNTLESGTTATTAQNDEFAVVGGTMRSTTVTVSSWTNSFVASGEEIVASGSKQLAASTKLLSSTGAVDTVGNLSASPTHMGMIATFKKQ